ncbi:MAG: hypothetical protein PHO42_03860 [Candidatus Omnitrophica bacterium]|nr:hypothetical protein [Candidatus Omnitrophota bacterium]
MFDKTVIDISKRKQPKFTYTLGSEVNTFADLAGCDMLIFIKEEGLQKSAGEIAKDVVKSTVFTVACLLVGVVATPIPQTSATIMHVAFVDANDGAILWYTNNGLNTNWSPNSDKQLFNLIKYLTGPFPDSAFKKKETKTTTNIIQPSETPKPAVTALPPVPQ